MNCKHGRKDWKCPYCKAEETQTVGFDIEALPATTSCDKEFVAELHKLPMIIDDKLLKKQLDSIEKWYKPNFIEESTGQAIAEFDRALRSHKLVTSKNNVRRLAHSLRECAGAKGILRRCNFAVFTFVCQWDTEETFTVDEVKCEFHKLHGTQPYDRIEKYDAYDGLEAIIFKKFGTRLSRDQAKKMSLRLYPYDDLMKCKPYAGDPTLTQFVWGRNTREYIRLLTFDELRRECFMLLSTYGTPGHGKTSINFDVATFEAKTAAQLAPTLKALIDARMADCIGDQFKNETLFGGFPFRALESGKKGDTIRVDLGTTETSDPNLFLIDRPDCTISIPAETKRATLIIGGVKYNIRFEGEKGHIIPC